MLVDTSLATTAMPIVAGAQPNYQGPQKPYRGRRHCLMRSPELVERIDRASADAPLARPPMWRNAGLPLGREKLFRLVAFTARGRKHTRQRKAAVIPRHEIEAHLGHLPLQISKDLSRSAIVLHNRMTLVLAVAPFLGHTVFQVPDDGRHAAG